MRAAAFRTIAQLAINYRRSPAATDGPNPPRRGPHAGDRLPDAPLLHGDQPTSLHAASAAPAYHLLLCGPTTRWPAPALATLAQRYGGLVAVHHLTRQHAPEILYDPDGTAHRRLGLQPAGHQSAHYLVRPDGHIGYRAGGADLTELDAYLARWLPGATPGEP